MGILDVPALPSATAKRNQSALLKLPGIMNGKLPGTMTTPPTITQAAPVVQGTSGTTGSTLTNPINYGYNTTNIWRFLGGVGWTAGSAYYQNGILGSSVISTLSLAPTWRVEFMFNGTAFEFALRGFNSGYYRIMVDGQWANNAVNIPGDGNRYLIKVDFGSRVNAKITIELDQLGWGGININSTDIAYMPPAPVTRALFLGDSYTYGTGANRLGLTWARQCADLLGWDDAWINGESGTGYVYDSASPKAKFESRVPVSVTPYSPDVIVVWGGYNDNGANVPGITATQLQAAATSLFAKLATDMPTVPVFVVGPQVTNNAIGQTNLDWAAAIKAACTASPNVVAYFPTYDTGNLWITGNGNSSAGRTVTDGVTTSGSTTITSATASFVSGDVGHIVTGAGIPANTKISSVTNSTTAVLSAAATATATAVSISITGQTGTGNSDVMIYTDGVHPSQTGHDYYAQRISRLIKAYYQSTVPQK